MRLTSFTPTGIGASRQTARLRILALGTGRQGRLSVSDFSLVLGLHMVLLLVGAIILVYIAWKIPGVKGRCRKFITGYFACVLFPFLALVLIIHPVLPAPFHP